MQIKYLFFLFLITLFLLNKIFADWLPLNSGSASNLNVIAVKSNEIIIGGNNSFIKKTQNKGKTFSSIILPFNFDIYSIFSVSDTITYIAGSNKKIFLSEDNGLTWQDKSANLLLADTEIITDIFFLSVNTGWIITASGKIYKTNDKCQSFTLQFSTSKKLNKIFFYNSDNGFAAGDKIFLKTANSGSVWTQHYLDLNLNFLDYCFVKENNLTVISTNSNKLFFTYNNWTSDSFVVLPISADTIFSIDSFDSKNFIVGCNDGKIFISNAEFTNFQQMITQIYYDIFDIKFVSLDEIWAVGKYGTLLNYRKGFSIYESKTGATYPIANAGKDILTNPDTFIFISAELSEDEDTPSLRYLWQQISGPEKILNDTTAKSFYISFPKEGYYKFQLKVTNLYDSSNIDFLNVFVFSDSFNCFNEINLSPDKFDDTYIRCINLLTSNENTIKIPVYNPNTNNYSEYWQIKFNPSESNTKLLIYKVNEDLYKGITKLAEYNNYKHTILGFAIFDINNNNRSKTLDIIDFYTKFNFSYYYDANAYNPETIQRFRIFYFDENKQEWDYLISVNDSIKKAIISETQFLYIIGLFLETEINSPTSPNLDNIVIYPNPFKPNDNNNRTGIDYNGSAGSGIYFQGLPTYCKIKIIDLAGKELFEITTNNQSYYQWNCRDKNNEIVQSGIYFVKFSFNNETVVKKLLIAR